MIMQENRISTYPAMIQSDYYSYMVCLTPVPNKIYDICHLVFTFVLCLENFCHLEYANSFLYLHIKKGGILCLMVTFKYLMH